MSFFRYTLLLDCYFLYTQFVIMLVIFSPRQLDHIDNDVSSKQYPPLSTFEVHLNCVHLYRLLHLYLDITLKIVVKYLKTFNDNLYTCTPLSQEKITFSSQIFLAFPSYNSHCGLVVQIYTVLHQYHSIQLHLIGY